jgi:hypothetical protein
MTVWVRNKEKYKTNIENRNEKSEHIRPGCPRILARRNSKSGEDWLRLGCGYHRASLNFGVREIIGCNSLLTQANL